LETVQDGVTVTAERKIGTLQCSLSNHAVFDGLEHNGCCNLRYVC